MPTNDILRNLKDRPRERHRDVIGCATSWLIDLSYLSERRDKRTDETTWRVY